LRFAYSLGAKVNSSIDEPPNIPYVRLPASDFMLGTMTSSSIIWFSSHIVPCSVGTKRSVGWRSKTPARMRWLTVRCAHSAISVTNTALDAG
jgi:hypothetical protein